MATRPASAPATAPAPVLAPALRWPAAVAAVLAAAVVAGLAARYRGQGGPDHFDAWLRSVLGATRPSVRLGARVVDVFGEPVVAAGLVVLLASACLFLRRRRLAVLAVTGPGATGAATTLLKPLVDRTIHGHNLAYPSGHTAAATALAIVVALLAGDLLRRAVGRLLLGLPVLAGAAMAWSQIALGAHYPTDTLGGFCTAVAVVPAAAWLVDRTAG